MSRRFQASATLADHEALYPLEFFVAATPISLQASNKSKQRWKTTVREAARERIRQMDVAWYLDRRQLAVTIYYFPVAPMAGDIDNIVKPIMDALDRVAYMSDNEVERIVVQKFEPSVDWEFANPGSQLVAVLNAAAPLVYVRVDDDLSWRRIA